MGKICKVMKNVVVVDLLFLFHFLFLLCLLLGHFSLCLGQILLFNHDLTLMSIQIVLLLLHDLALQFFPLPFLVMLLFQLLVNYRLVSFLWPESNAAAHGRSPLLLGMQPLQLLLLDLLLQYVFNQHFVLCIFQILELLELACLVHVGVELIYVFLIFRLLLPQFLLKSCPCL